MGQVGFKLLSLSGTVGLEGKLSVVPDGNNDMVTVAFEPPVLRLGGICDLCIGPPSSVRLTTTYLDDRVRLGLGGRGSLFVFKRLAIADLDGEHCGWKDFKFMPRPLMQRKCISRS